MNKKEFEKIKNKEDNPKFTISFEERNRAWYSQGWFSKGKQEYLQDVFLGTYNEAKNAAYMLFSESKHKKNNFTIYKNGRVYIKEIMFENPEDYRGCLLI